MSDLGTAGAASGQVVEVAGHRAVLRADRGTGTVVYADDWTGAALGLGYQTASDRPGQMDVLRRTARGTLAALLGRRLSLPTCGTAGLGWTRLPGSASNCCRPARSPCSTPSPAA